MVQTPQLLLNLEGLIREKAFVSFLKRFSRLHHIPLLVIDRQGIPLFRTAPIQVPGKFILPEREDRYSRLYLKAGLSLRIQPLTIYNHLIGYLSCPAVEGDENREDLLDLATSFVQYYLTSHFEIESLSQEMVETYEEINFFFDFSESLCSVSTLTEVCQKAVDKVAELLRAKRASILLLGKRADYFSIAAAHGLDHVDPHVKIPCWKGIAGKVLGEGEPILIDDCSTLPEELTPNREKYQSNSFVSVPLKLHRKGGKKILGILNIADKTSGDPFTSSNLKLIQAIADQLAIFINQIQFIEIQKEMQLAREIQKNFLPRHFPQVKGIELAGHCSPAKNVGGDYYDYFPYGEDCLGLVIADVSGHNTASALLMATARSTLRSVLNTHRHPPDVLRETNMLLIEDLEKADLLISMFFVDLDARTGELSCSNAGHNYPLLWKASAREAVQLDVPGTILGFMEDTQFQHRRLSMDPGDLLLLYTDGVVESRNRKDEFFGEERLVQFLQDHQHLSAKDFLEILLARVNHFAGGRGREDDITLMVLKRI